MRNAILIYLDDLTVFNQNPKDKLGKNQCFAQHRGSENEGHKTV